MNQCEERSHDILGGQKHNGNLAQRCYRYCWLKSTFSFPSCTQTLCSLLHACLLHAEGDLGVLVAEQNVCNARGWIARGV